VHSTLEPTAAPGRCAGPVHIACQPQHVSDLVLRGVSRRPGRLLGSCTICRRAG